MFVSLCVTRLNVDVKDEGISWPSRKGRMSKIEEFTLSCCEPRTNKILSSSLGFTIILKYFGFSTVEGLRSTIRFVWPQFCIGVGTIPLLPVSPVRMTHSTSTLRVCQNTRRIVTMTRRQPLLSHLSSPFSEQRECVSWDSFLISLSTFFTSLLFLFLTRDN